MVNEELDGEATETFSFRMSKALRERLRSIAATNRRTLGREVVIRLISSFEGVSMDAAIDEDTFVPASREARAALALAEANKVEIAELKARIEALEQLN